MRRLLLLLLVALVLPAPAGAATVSSFDDWNENVFFARDAVEYRAAPGEVNDLSISLADGRYVVVDPGAVIEPGEGCRLTDSSAHRAECDTHERLGATVTLDDMDDRALVRLPHGDAHPARPATEIDGGAGSDRLEGGDSFDLLKGGEGTDLLFGNAHGDFLFGGPGEDRLEGGEDDFTTFYVFDPPGSGTEPLPSKPDELDGGTGRDVLSGGPGIGDGASYADRTAPVHVSPGLLPDDGEAGERDLVMNDIEVLRGGRGDDTLVGTGVFNGFFAGAGNDVVFGGGGFHDFPFAGPGDDTLYLYDGEPEGSGTRGIFPGTHYDDSFDCGDHDLPPEPPGFDVVVADAGDSAVESAHLRGCERVLFGDTPIRIGPGDPSVVTDVVCPVLQALLECTGVIDIQVPVPVVGKAVKGPGRFRVPSRWRKLGGRSFTARRKGRRVRIQLTAEGRRYLAKHPRSRVYPTFAFRKVRRVP